MFRGWHTGPASARPCAPARVSGESLKEDVEGILADADHRSAGVNFNERLVERASGLDVWLVGPLVRLRDGVGQVRRVRHRRRPSS
ncbi:hypothetical protein FRAHR75_770006 [Frankia sp. Hr75.2]|nr:hypothetical protein FRAHR75_770006 [Frankia sp. Hr75.2]